MKIPYQIYPFTRLPAFKSVFSCWDILRIEEMDMDSLPSYACFAKMDELYASYERLHLLKNENRKKTGARQDM